MGSLRNPVGPLPSSIYWRRRVFMLSALVVLALLIAWIVTSNGGGGKKNADGSDGKNPVSTITPGPSGSGPAISQAPGGRDGSSGSGSGGGSGSSSGSSSGSGDGSSGATGGGTSAGSTGSGGSSGSSGSSSGSGDDVTSGSGGTVASLPGTSTLPNCTAGSVSLTLRSLHNSYSPEQTPTFELTAKNTSSSDCKIDLGPKNAVLTITQASADDTYWSSADCPKSAAGRWYRVPSGSSITYTLKWDRKPSAAQCATPAAGSAGTGTYLLEATAPGYAKAQASFVLTAD